MTAENPWLMEGSNPEPTDAETDPFRALGFGFSEESPTMAAEVVQPRVEPTAPVHPVSQEPAPWSSAPAPTGTPLAGPSVEPAMPVAPLASFSVTPPIQSAVASEGTVGALAPTSRRALREAQRSEPAVPHPQHTDSTIAPAPTMSGSGRRSARAAVTAPPARAPRPSHPPRATAVTTPHTPLSRRIAKKAFPPAVMLAVASLLVGTSVPANALFDPDAPPASIALSSIAEAKAPETVALEGQVLEAEAVGDLASTAAARDTWTVTSYAEMLRMRYGSVSYAYNASGTGPIRWPFPFAAPITSAFGDRVAPCRGCSSYHRGVDFDAGYGAPVGAIADGIVTAVGRSSSFGYRVEIEHIINGQKVMSLYAHLIDNSSVLTVGSQVVAGEIVGALGNTGLSTGPHLHLEIHVDSVPIDPFAWLVSNAG